MSANIVIVLLILHTFSDFTIGQPKNKFFRKDYRYIAETQSFYKIHTLHKTWSDAKKRCALEGATFFYPEDKAEADAVRKFWNETQPFSWVYIGVSDLLAKGAFETVDGIPIGDVYNNWSPGEPNDADGVEDCVILRRDGTLNDDKCGRKYPFICKKTLVSLDWNTLCDIPDNDYVYEPHLGKCYKFHLKPMNWTDAYTICNAEQSYLAIINNQAEADYFVNITEKASTHRVIGKYTSGVVYLGFHNRDNDGWQTIKGVPIEDSGYSVWGNQQPDGGEKELCGSMFNNGHLNDMGCDRRCLFICEHEIGLLSQAFDERLASIGFVNSTEIPSDQH